MIISDQLDTFMTVSEVAQLLHLHNNTVRRWSNQGMIRSYRINRRGDRRFKQEDIYRFGLLAGPFKTYYEDGTLQSEGEFKSNRLHGPFKSYHANGKVKEEGEYIAARKHKAWKEYDEQGNLLRTFNFKAGILIETQED